MPGSATLFRGNALTLPLANEIADLVVTSPPYFGLRSYQDSGEHYAGQIGDELTPREFVDSLIAATREMVRVVKPGGSIWINLGDKYAAAERGPDGSSSALTNGEQHRVGRNRPITAFGVPRKSLIGIPARYMIRCIDDLRLILRAEVIWKKSNGLPESAGDRAHRSHEHWFHFTKQPTYYSSVDEIREERDAPTRTPGANSMSGRNANLPRTGTGDWDGPTALGKMPGSVWEIATQPLNVPDHVAHAVCCAGSMRAGCMDGIDHHAAFPMEWPRRIIRGWCPPGGVVLDPFGGTGTTALVAKVLGRTGISVDMSADYCRIAQWRTTDPGEIARAMQVKKPAKQTEGQVSMLDLFQDGAA